MKKNYAYSLTAFLLLIPLLSLAQDVSPTITKGWFTLQKKVEKNLSTRNQGMASISFNGIIFNFVNYNAKLANDDYSSSNSSVVVRKLTNDKDYQPHWLDDKIDNIKVFQGLYLGNFQPAPVIFNDTLYLFVLNNAAQIAYSRYDPIADSWSKLKVIAPADVISVNTRYNNYNYTGMSASVVNNKLCLVGSFNNTITIYWTDEEMTNWRTCNTGLQTYCTDYSGDLIHNGDKHKAFPYISAIGSAFMDKNIQTEKLMFGYIDNGIHVAFAEYYFNSDSSLQFIKTSSLSQTSDADANTYTSVALANGSVTGDPTSTGKCMQAFVKCYDIQNLSASCRIKRFELKNGVWSEAENNLVVQDYGWAWAYSNLSVTNYALPDGQDFRQFMCLLYQSKYGSDYPLNCAWAETDRWVWLDHDQKLIQDEANTHYVGYIEGAPPFRINDSVNRALQKKDLYFFGEGSSPISRAEFTVTDSSQKTTELSFKVHITSKLRAGWLLEASVNEGMRRIYKPENETTINESDEYIAGEGSVGKYDGMYLAWKPEVSRERYKVKDVHNNLIDSICYFYVSGTYKFKIFVALPDNLNPSQPRTYFNRSAQLNYNNYIQSEKGDAVWAPNSKGSHEVTYKKTDTDGTKYNVKIELGFGKNDGENDDFFQGGPSGEFEYTSTATTSTESRIKCGANLNKPGDSLDCSSLAYKVYWLKRTIGCDNWWLPIGAKDQDTWCLTYSVYDYQLLKGPSYGSGTPKSPDITLDAKPAIPLDAVAPGDVSGKIIPLQSSLAQNAPNPFNRITRIKYQVADEKLPSNTQGCITTLVIYNLSGQQVATLVNENKAPGSYEVEWDASQLTPGVYFYSMQSGSFKDRKKLILLK